MAPHSTRPQPKVRVVAKEPELPYLTYLLANSNRGMIELFLTIGDDGELCRMLNSDTKIICEDRFSKAICLSKNNIKS